MKAFRNIGGNVVEIQVDVDPNGNPILPPDTTIDPKPEAAEGHYVTVVGKNWVQIPFPVPFKTFETKKNEVLEKIKAYKDWLLEQPVEHNGVLFDADDVARGRISQALVVHSATGQLPPVWITYTDEPYAITAVDDLNAISGAVFAAFSQRFYECDTLRSQVVAAETEEALYAIEVPAVPITL